MPPKLISLWNKVIWMLLCPGILLPLITSADSIIQPEYLQRPVWQPHSVESAQSHKAAPQFTKTRSIQSKTLLQQKRAEIRRKLRQRFSDDRYQAVAFGGSTGDTAFYVGGQVTGLKGDGLVLKFNDRIDVKVRRNGRFNFHGNFSLLEDYEVVIKQQPQNPAQSCEIQNAIGEIDGSRIDNILVDCATDRYTIGGSVVGLEGTTLALQLNEKEKLILKEDGRFRFKTRLRADSNYELAHVAQAGRFSQYCKIDNASGRVTKESGNNIQITCTTDTFKVSGTIVGLQGKGLLLENINGEQLEIKDNGTFTFKQPVLDGAMFEVVVARHPRNLDQLCTVTNGRNSIKSKDVINLQVYCSSYIAGILDTSFGHSNGESSSRVGTLLHHSAAGGEGADFATGMVADTKNNIMVSGYSLNAAGNYDMVVWRFNSLGLPDVEFGSHHGSFTGKGYIVHHNAAGGRGFDQGNKILLDPQGRLLVVGHSLNAQANYDMVVWRYDSRGLPDTSFGMPDPKHKDPARRLGYVTHHNAAGGVLSDYGTGMALDKKGRILVTGHSRNLSGNEDMVVWRFTTEGKLDASFGKDQSGYVVHHNAAGGGRDDYGNAIVVDANNRILVGGYSDNGTGLYDMVIWALTEEGKLDPAFGDKTEDKDVRQGYAVFSGINGLLGSKAAYGITLDKSGHILLTGFSTDHDNNSQMTLWRFQTDGTLDTGFGDQDPASKNPLQRLGYTLGANQGESSRKRYGQAISVDENNRILVTGYIISNSGSTDMMLWRFNPDGDADKAFGDINPVVKGNNNNRKGYLVHQGGQLVKGQGHGKALSIDGQGRIIIAGYGENDRGDMDVVVWRYK